MPIVDLRTQNPGLVLRLPRQEGSGSRAVELFVLVTLQRQGMTLRLSR